MTAADFELLCWEACEELELDDSTALASPEGALVDGVHLQALYPEGHAAFVLLAELGFVEAAQRAEVYETLLEMQLAAWDEPQVRFGLHPRRGAPVLCMRVEVNENATGEWLAKLLRSVAAQVAHWQEEQLAGRVEKRGPAFRGIEAGVREGALASHI